MESNRKFSVHNILSNQKALVVISFFTALIIWIAVSLVEAPEVERVIEHVAVTIDDNVPNQLGYEAFGVDEVYVDITVKGKRYLVGDNVLSAEDFTVSAVTTYVDTPGSYTLQLKATSNDPNANYTIVSKSQEYLEVYFDTPKTTEVVVEPKVVCEENELLYSDEYITEDAIASVNKITVTGPATEVDKIDRAVATIITDGNLKATETKPSVLTIVDAYGSELKYLTVDNVTEDITVTIPVYKVAELPVSVDFSNIPLYYIENPLTVVCSPAKLRVAVDESKLESMESISIGTVDFSKLAPGLNTIELDTSKIKDAIPMNPEQKFYVYINTGSVEQSEYTILPGYINLLSNNSEYTVKIDTDGLKVILIGPKDSLESLANGDVYAEIDTGSLNLAPGNASVPVTIRIKDNRCWAYGKYSVNISVAERQ